MRIVINHLTRMHGGHICTAGVEVDSRRHVRPVLDGQPLPFYLLSSYGGPFEMGRVLDLGFPRSMPVPPHVEDYVFVPARARMIRRACPKEFWKLLEEIAQPSLAEIFGDCLRPVRSTAKPFVIPPSDGNCGQRPAEAGTTNDGPAGHGAYAAEVGTGKVSLGCLRLQSPAELILKEDLRGKKKLRIKFSDGQLNVDASVTDLRLFADDHATPNAAAVCAAKQGLNHSRDVILCVGLTRPYSPGANQPPRHWLQVNNLHFEDDPLWIV